MTPEQFDLYLASLSRDYGLSRPPAIKEGDIITIQHSSVGNFTGRVDKVVPMGRGEYHMTLTKVPEEGECKN